jgi:hypothetical protein
MRRSSCIVLPMREELPEGVQNPRTVPAASLGDARAHGIREGRSEKSIGPFLCALSRIREDDRDLKVN